MIRHKDHFHGSDLEKIEKIYHIPKEEIISFSANVNPLGLSPLLKTTLAEHIDVLCAYPDRDYTLLKKAISDYCHIPAEYIFPGNGTSELITLFTQLIAPRRAIVVGPTYSEYERAISIAGGRTHYFPLQEDDNFKIDAEGLIKRIDDETDLIIICNPNNPTGTAVPNATMRHILDACKLHHTYVMADETYIEFSPSYDEHTGTLLCADYSNLIVLRGTSKFFAAPGLRLGYAICSNRRISEMISRGKSPWMVGSLAETAGRIMFSDTAYIEKTRQLITKERSRLFSLYSQSGRFRPYTPNANFMLMRILDESSDSHKLFERAIRQKMMIRDCSTFPFLNDRFIRICFMMPDDNDRLADCLLS